MQHGCGPRKNIDATRWMVLVRHESHTSRLVLHLLLFVSEWLRLVCWGVWVVSVVLLFELDLSVQCQDYVFLFFEPALSKLCVYVFRFFLFSVFRAWSECTMSRISVFLFSEAKVDHGGGPNHICLGPPPWSTLAAKNRKTEKHSLDIVHSDLENSKTYIRSSSRTKGQTRKAGENQQNKQFWNCTGRTDSKSITIEILKQHVMQWPEQASV